MLPGALWSLKASLVHLEAAVTRRELVNFVTGTRAMKAAAVEVAWVRARREALGLPRGPPSSPLRFPPSFPAGGGGVAQPCASIETNPFSNGRRDTDGEVWRAWFGDLGPSSSTREPGPGRTVLERPYREEGGGSGSRRGQKRGMQTEVSSRADKGWRRFGSRNEHAR